MKKLYALLFLSALTMTAVAAPSRVHRRAAGANAVQVLPATDVTLNGFTANWKAYAGAETYMVNLYEPVEITADGEYCVLEENFNLVNKGTMVEPEYEQEVYLSISDTYDWTYTPDWWAFYGVYARGMVSGIIQSPYMDLTADGGKFTVEFSVCGYQGAEVRLEANGATSDVRSFILTTTGENVFKAEFSNGVHDTYLTFKDLGITNDPEGQYLGCIDFLDDITVTQQFKAGDIALRPVGVAETEKTSHTFESLPYAYGATHLCYDVQANIVTYNDPDDPWDYDVEYSDFSDMQHVYLANQDGISSAIVDDAAGAVYYNLQGVEMRAADLVPGLYVRRQGDKSEKVLIR